MSEKITNVDRAAVVRDAWGRAYVAAIAAAEPVRLHLGAAFREAWSAFRQDRAEGRQRVSMTADYEERYGRSDRVMARQHLGRLLAEKAAAAPVPVEARQVMRGIILKRIDLNDASMTRLRAELEGDVAVYGLSHLTDHTHDRLDGLHTDGVNLRGELADLDAGGVPLVPNRHHADPSDAARIAELRARDAVLTRDIDGLAAAAQAWIEGRDAPGGGDAVPTLTRLWDEREWLRVKISAEESAAAAKLTAASQLDLVVWLATAPAMVTQQAQQQQAQATNPERARLERLREQERDLTWDVEHLGGMVRSPSITDRGHWNYVARMEAKWNEREEIRARIRSLESRLEPRA